MKYLSIGKNGITLFFFMGIMVMISTALVAYLNSSSQLDSNNYIINSYSKINLIEKIKSNISDAEGLRKVYETNTDIQNVYAIDNIKTETDSLIKLLTAISADNSKQRGRVDTLNRIVSGQFILISQSMDIINKKRSNPRLLKPVSDKSKINRSDLNGILSRLKSDEFNTVNMKNSLASQGYRFTFYTIAGGTFVSSLIFIVIFFYLKRSSRLKSGDDEEITKDELEKIIRDRTSELSHINNKLNSKIAELKNMDEVLKQSVNYYKTLFEQAHDAIMIMDPENEIVLDVNKRACEIYGFSREEFIGLSIKSISKNVKMGEENIQKTLETGFFHNFQTVHYNKHFNEMLMEINASVIEYNNKKAVLSINRDITERVLMIH